MWLNKGSPRHWDGSTGAGSLHLPGFLHQPLRAISIAEARILSASEMNAATFFLSSSMFQLQCQVSNALDFKMQFDYSIVMGVIEKDEFIGCFV